MVVNLIFNGSEYDFYNLPFVLLYRKAKECKWKEAGWPNSTYVVSKVGVSALTRIQQRAFDADAREDLVVNSCHPGYVDTDMTSHKVSCVDHYTVKSTITIFICVCNELGE